MSSEYVKTFAAGSSGSSGKPVKSETYGTIGARGRTVLGIDLGTTHSVVAACSKGRVEIFATDSGSRTTPSVVGFFEGRCFVGDAARDVPSEMQVFDAKRLIGRGWKEVVSSISQKHWPFLVLEKNDKPYIRVTIKGKKVDLAPEEISAVVLKNLKETAEAVLNETVTEAVVTVPAYFNETQRQATKLAGKVAGLDVIAMINEPTAAAIAYGLDKKKGADGDSTRKTVFIYDLGGGTFDVSVMTVKGTDFKVLASDGDVNLGGQDFDERLLQHFIEEVRAMHGVTLDQPSVQELRRACELAKRKLSSISEAPLTVFFGRLNLAFKSSISRATFEGLCSDLLRKTIQISANVLAAAKVAASAVDDVVLVGGSTRIPKVQSLLRDLFDGREPRRSINPDEAVAYGAAVHAAVLAGDKAFCNLVKLRDVTPLSLGIALVADAFSVVIPRNSPIPCERAMPYVNAEDFQKKVRFEVFQGEQPLCKDNHSLGKSFCVPVQPKLRGENKLDCTFRLDADGLLTVWAVDRDTGNRSEVSISPEEAKVSREEVKRMLSAAARLRQQDQRARTKTAKTERAAKRKYSD